jgi:hypothetical protein
LGISVRVFPMEITVLLWLDKVGHHPLGSEPRRNKERQKCLSVSKSWDALLGHHNARVPGLWTSWLTPAPILPSCRFSGFQPWVGNHTIGCHGSEAFRFELSCAAVTPGSPACSWPVMGLLNFHNCVSQFL